MYLFCLIISIAFKSINCGLIFNDALWPKQWYLNPNDQGDHMDIPGAWDQGYTGEGIHVVVVDDGLDHDHPDLVENYDPKTSIDLADNDYDPAPGDSWSDVQGTKSAGIIAAEGNNSIGIVGVAPHVEIGAIRLPFKYGNITDDIEAEALGFNKDTIDIYSMTWGPDDDGKTLDGPGTKARHALKKGVDLGRNGKGSIYVWAAGTGGRNKDDCNFDGYQTSIYTISLSSVNDNGVPAWYTEHCSAALAVTYSSGQSVNKMIHSTAVDGEYGYLSGTSVSAVIGAGILALTLEANPELTWRDMQHLIVRTSSFEHLTDENHPWSRNGAGYNFSSWHGFGLMNANSMVSLAKSWTNVPKMTTCEVSHEGLMFVEISEYNAFEKPLKGKIFVDANNCKNINYIEHVQIIPKLTTGLERGSFRFSLTSPSGTKSQITNTRPNDYTKGGFENFNIWPMMTVHFWDEPVNYGDLKSNWIIEWEIDRDLDSNPEEANVQFQSWTLIFHGTEE